MARPQADLQAKLVALANGNRVYFQPPANAAMEFPCIVYKRDRMPSDFADNIPFVRTKRYLLTVISADPNDPMVDAVAELPMCLMNRAYSANNLNHDVFVLHF